MPPPDDEKIIIDSGFAANTFDTIAALSLCGEYAMQANIATVKGELSKEARDKIVKAEKAMEPALLRLQKEASIVALAFEQALAQDGD